MEFYPNSNNTTLLKAALSQAENRKPVFPCERGGKKPLTEHGYLDATTDPRKIHMWWNRHPGANIGIPTGERSGILAVDHDTYKDEAASLEEVEATFGPVSDGVTVETGKGGRQYLFRYPEGSNIRNAAGILPGVDIRGEGGYILAPGSVTKGIYRRLDRHQLSDPPPQLVRALTEPQKTVSKVRNITTAVSINTEGRAIPEGSRDDTLTRIAGRLHDGTRSLDDLAAELLEINIRRCEPPLPESQVLKVAKSIHGKEPCRSGRPRELDELVGVLSDYWHGQGWKKFAGKSDARFVRALIREGRRIGTVIPMGLRVEESYREMAETIGVHVNTITNIVKRGKAAGWLRQDNANRRGPESGAFVLMDPRRICDTTNHASGVDEDVTSLSRFGREPLNVADLTTAHHRHRGTVGYSKEHTLCVFEAHGPQDREAAAGLLGWSRPRDLERLHLEPLAALGLLEKRGHLYGVPGDYGERREKVRGEDYSTVQLRVRRVRSVEGRFVHVVKESGIVASEVSRARLDEQKHARERDAYRYWLANSADTHHELDNADGFISELERVRDEDRVSLSSLAVAIRDYLDRHPHQARQPAGWLGVTVWAEGLHTKLENPPAETKAAIEELGGSAYLKRKLEEAREVA
jgi:hypothetical protein